jgi:hypothetical protein
VGDFFLRWALLHPVHKNGKYIILKASYKRGKSRVKIKLTEDSKFIHSGGD